MTGQGIITSQLPIKTSLFDANDGLVFVYGLDTANTSNSISQTALITVKSFAANFANNLQLQVQQPDPANSTALPIQQGVVFASNTYLYCAIANNITRRLALSSF